MQTNTVFNTLIHHIPYIGGAGALFSPVWPSLLKLLLSFSRSCYRAVFQSGSVFGTRFFLFCLLLARLRSTLSREHSLTHLRQDAGAVANIKTSLITAKQRFFGDSKRRLWQNVLSHISLHAIDCETWPYCALACSVRNSKGFIGEGYTV